MDEAVQYLPAHRVLVCLQCKYAIQPSAISSHFKNYHQIYRGRRNRLLEYANGLDLVQPADVTIPPPESDPVPILKVEKGFACNADGCGHLCITAKRMKSHWTERHGSSGLSTVNWRPVAIQTFFRGIHLRYFIVNASTTTDSPIDSETSASQPGPSSRGSRLASDSRRLSTHAALIPTPVPPAIPENFAMADLRLLHHYTLHTSMTLHHGAEPPNFWSETVVELAFASDFLMHGLLGISALHLAYLDKADRESFLNSAFHHHRLALPHFRRATENPDPDISHAVLVFARLIIAHACGSKNISGEYGTDADDGGDTLQEFLRLMRGGCAIMNEAMSMIAQGPAQPLLPREPVIPADARLVQQHLNPLHDALSTLCEDPDVSQGEADIYRDAFHKLHRAFAIASHVDIPYGIWQGIEFWPSTLSAAYLELLEDRDVGAAVIFSYYCILVKQVQHCWYMETLASRLLDIIANSLGPDKKHLLSWPTQQIVG